MHAITTARSLGVTAQRDIVRSVWCDSRLRATLGKDADKLLDGSTEANVRPGEIICQVRDGYAPPPPAMIVSGLARVYSTSSQGRQVTVLAGRQALTFAGLSIDEIDVLETVVPFAFLIPMILEDLGVCARGEVANYLREGGLDRAARVPINTNGGMLSFGQSFLNCVMDQLLEGLQQLDGTALGDRVAGAKRAMVHSHGGVIAAHTVAIFERS